MDPLLVDSVFRAMILLETAPINKDFDEETLSFLQDLYLWRRPEKFLVGERAFKFVAGRVSYWKPGQRVLQFEFDNGYVWEASITKLGSKSLIAHCKELVEQYFADEEAAYLAEAAA